MKYAKPFYSVSINVGNCGYDIRMNDCPLQAHRKRSISTRMPINEWIHRGDNRLSAQLFPLPYEDSLRPDARLSIEIHVREDEGNDSEIVDHIEFRADDLSAEDSETRASAADVVAGKEADTRRIERDIAIDVPFETWNWHRSELITATDDIRSELLAECDKLHACFAAGDLDRVVELSEERNRERGAALYLSMDEMTAMQRQSYKSLSDDYGFTLQPPIKDDAILTVYGEGRLARLANRFGEATLFYADESVTTIGQLTFIFRRNKDGRWIICR